MSDNNPIETAVPEASVINCRAITSSFEPDRDQLTDSHSTQQARYTCPPPLPPVVGTVGSGLPEGGKEEEEKKVKTREEEQRTN